MTFRFSTNISAGYTESYNVLWGLYSFFTASPPNGPGWIEIGGGNGTSGGMTDGYITSVSSFGVTNSWFAIQMPSSDRQFMFYRVSSTTFSISYSKGGLFTGGGAATVPTATDQLDPQDFANSTASTFHICADDAEPYGFWFFWKLLSQKEAGPVFLYLPMEGGLSTDVDPYVLYGTNTGISISSMTDTNSVGVLSTNKPMAWAPDGSAAYKVGLWGMDNIAKAQKGTAVVAFPLVAGNRFTGTAEMYKGYTILARMWAGDADAVPDCTRVGNGSWIKIRKILLPWNGANPL